MVPNTNGDPTDRYEKIQDRYIESLVRVLDDVTRGYPANRGKVIVNMSFGWTANLIPWVKLAHHQILCKFGNPQTSCMPMPERRVVGLTLYSVLLDKILVKLDAMGVVLVAASHNNYQYGFVRNRLDGWPSRFGAPGETDQPLPNLMVSSGTDMNTEVSVINPYADWLVMAPGFQVAVAGAKPNSFALADGASLC